MIEWLQSFRPIRGFSPSLLSLDRLHFRALQFFFEPTLCGHSISRTHILPKAAGGPANKKWINPQIWAERKAWHLSAIKRAASCKPTGADCLWFYQGWWSWSALKQFQFLPRCSALAWLLRVWFPQGSSWLPEKNLMDYGVILLVQPALRGSWKTGCCRIIPAASQAWIAIWIDCMFLKGNCPFEMSLIHLHVLSAVFPLQSQVCMILWSCLHLPLPIHEGIHSLLCHFGLSEPRMKTSLKALPRQYPILAPWAFVYQSQCRPTLLWLRMLVSILQLGKSILQRLACTCGCIHGYPADELYLVIFSTAHPHSALFSVIPPS